MMQTELIAPVGELIRRHAQSKPGKLAFRDSKSSFTYGSLAERTANLAGNLQALGIRPGDSVAMPRRFRDVASASTSG